MTGHTLGAASPIPTATLLTPFADPRSTNGRSPLDEDREARRERTLAVVATVVAGVSTVMFAVAAILFR
ncbi:hypothetical protein [Curtobacterium sp. L1-20]|uniref:hypothetical protein n=1 Tax=Curtobacterium sp. L1-20 TaxID=3138181 RepID=UPI003B516B5E